MQFVFLYNFITIPQLVKETNEGANVLRRAARVYLYCPNVFT